MSAHEDTSSMEEIYNEYFPRLFRYVYVRVGDSDDAHDITHSVFLRFFKQEREPKHLSAYLFRSARNAVIDHWKKKKAIPASRIEEDLTALPDDSQSAETKIRKDEDALLLQDAMQHLNEAQQDVLTMRFMGHLSTKEIAKATGKTEANVRQIQVRGLKALRDTMKDHYE